MSESGPPTVDISVDDLAIGANEEIPEKRARKSGGRIPGSGQSAIWDYFTKNEKNSICNICKQTFPHKNPSNLCKHLESSHTKEYGEFSKKTEVKRQQAEKRGQLRQQASGGIQTKLNFSSGSQSETKKKYKSTDLRQIRRSSAVAHLFASNSIAYRIVESKEFREFCQIMDPQFDVPSRGQLKRKVAETCTKMKRKIVDHLREVRKVSISTDIWSKRGLKESYCGIIAHYFDPYNHKIQRVLLAVRKLDGSHTGELIRETVFDVLTEYQLPVSKVWHFVTDSGSNVICAFKNVVEIVEYLRDDVTDSNGGNVNIAAIDPNLEDELTQDMDEDDSDNFDEQESDHFSAFGREKRLSCIAHKLVTVLRKYVDKDSTLKPLFESVKALIRTIRSSVRCNEILCGLTGGKGLISPATTRWLFMNYVLERMVELKPEITALIEQRSQQLGDLELTRLQWKQCEAVHMLLKKFAQHTTDLEGELYGTSSKVIPALFDLIESCSDDDLPLSVQIVALNLREGLEEKFQYILNPSSFGFQPLYAVATLLDPAFGHSLEEKLKIAAKAEIIRLCLKESECLQETPSPTPSSHTHSQTPKKYGGFFKRAASVAVAPAVSAMSLASRSVETKLDQYIQEIVPFGDENSAAVAPEAIQFWKEKLGTSLKELAILALDILSVPATSAGVERVFSHAGIATSNRRQGLSGENLENEVMMRVNNDFLNS